MGPRRTDDDDRGPPHSDRGGRWGWGDDNHPPRYGGRYDDNRYDDRHDRGGIREDRGRERYEDYDDNRWRGRGGGDRYGGPPPPRGRRDEWEGGGWRHRDDSIPRDPRYPDPG